MNCIWFKVTSRLPIIKTKRMKILTLLFICISSATYGQEKDFEKYAIALSEITTKNQWFPMKKVWSSMKTPIFMGGNYSEKERWNIFRKITQYDSYTMRKNPDVETSITFHRFLGRCSQNGALWLVVHNFATTHNYAHNMHYALCI